MCKSNQVDGADDSEKPPEKQAKKDTLFDIYPEEIKEIPMEAQPSKSCKNKSSYTIEAENGTCCMSTGAL